MSKAITKELKKELLMIVGSLSTPLLFDLLRLLETVNAVTFLSTLNETIAYEITFREERYKWEKRYEGS